MLKGSDGAKARIAIVSNSAETPAARRDGGWRTLFRASGRRNARPAGAHVVGPRQSQLVARPGKRRGCPRRLPKCRQFRPPLAYARAMRIVTYRDLRPGRFGKPLERLRAALGRGDFAAAGLKKLAPTSYWRAKLSDEARL